MVLLAAVVGYPDLGPALFPALYHQVEQKPDQPWTDWIDGLRPRRPDPDTTAQWTHPLEGRITPARTHRWENLVTALLHVDSEATAAGLPLPHRLEHWQPWVIPVGRLSFPTGPTVTRLIPDARPLASDN